MTHQKIDRRVFVATSAKAGFAVCGLCMGSALTSFAGGGLDSGDGISLEGRCFCGYKCPDDCAFKQGTLTDNVELKQKAWKTWKIEERYGQEFDEDQAICYGCNTMDKPEGVVLANCTVRQCAIARGEECCIDCDDLLTCDKDLWTRFPEFKNQVIDAQKTYRAQKA